MINRNKVVFRLTVSAALLLSVFALILSGCGHGSSGEVTTASSEEVTVRVTEEETTVPDPGDVTTSEATTAEATTAEATTTEATTAEATTAEATTAEVTTAEVTTAEVTTAEATTAEVTTAEVTTAEVTTGEITTTHLHSWGTWSVVTKATCEQPGLEKRSCACGQTQTRNTSALGHTKVTDRGTPATCTESGISDGTHCSVCGKVLEAQTVIQPLGHSFGENNKCVRCGITDPDLGTLLFYEDFEKYSTSSNSATVLRVLGWKADSPAGGAYKGNTTAYSLVSKNSSKQLYLKNNTNSGTDSYVIVLPASLLGKYHESNYTYQFDLVYDDASAADRYIALVSDYNGPTYNSFHFRNRGTANNQVHSNGTWYTYDASGVDYAANTNANSIVTKLLGKTYNASTQAFKGISVSIRYVVDWQNGNSVYMRVNTAGYPGTSKWTLVSKYSKSGTANDFLDPGKFGGALVLKTGGKQNGWIDNIAVWTGTGAEPFDKSSPLFKSTDTGCSGHRFEGEGTCLHPEACVYCGELSANNAPHDFVSIGVEGNTDMVCSVCGILQSNVGSRWKIEEIPSFDAGTLSSEVYLAGQGPGDHDLPLSAESEMLIASSVSPDDLSAYRTKLVGYGYNSEYYLERDGNVYCGYFDGSRRIYVYYTAYSNEIRVIYDRSGDSIADFGYTYEKQPGERTVVYQYGIPMSANGYGVDSANNTDSKINCGMMYVIKLADGKLLIIDGGGYQQFDTAEIDGLMAFMREITGRSSGKIDIAAWYITHCHSDHLAGFCLFLKKYSSSLNIERMIYNFPSTMTEDGVLSGHKANYQKLINYIKTYIGDVRFLKLHTGMSVTLCDLTINCIYTHEDLVDKSTGKTKIASDFNNSTTVSRMDFDGIRFMVLGDVNKPGQTVFLAANSAATMKSDIVQLAHHMYNDLSLAYLVIQAEAVFAPQSAGGAQRTSTTKTVYSVSKQFVTDMDNLYKYGGSGTYGYAAGADGKPELVYARDAVDGGGHTGWSW